MPETKNVNVNWGSTPISVVPMRGAIGTTGVWGVTGRWGVTGISIQGTTGVWGITGRWGVTGVTPSDAALLGAASNTFLRTNGSGNTTISIKAQSGKAAVFQLQSNGDLGLSVVNSSTGSVVTIVGTDSTAGTNLAIQAGSGSSGTGGAVSISGGNSDSGQGGSLTFSPGFGDSGANNGAVTINNANSNLVVHGDAANDVYLGNALGVTFLGDQGSNVYFKGHLNWYNDDYNVGITIFENSAILGSAGQMGALAVYREGSLIGYIPVFSVA